MVDNHNDYRPIVLNGAVGKGKQHDSFEAAREEARRLAATTDDTFVVYVPALLVRPQKAPLEEVVLTPKSNVRMPQGGTVSTSAKETGYLGGASTPDLGVSPYE